MAAFERILIPTDLSDFATLAFKYGVLFNKQVGSKLTLLFVEDVAISFEALEMPLGYYLEEAPQAREVLMEKLRDQARALAPGVSIETAVATDTPSRAIVTLGDQMRADLIIMGTHGRRGLERAFLGSVTERVLRHTDRPILTVTPNRIKLD
ncbi:MAG: universal stress protein, partial [Thermoanaerobaculia bacterium]